MSDTMSTLIDVFPMSGGEIEVSETEVCISLPAILPTVTKIFDKTFPDGFTDFTEGLKNYWVVAYRMFEAMNNRLAEDFKEYPGKSCVACFANEGDEKMSHLVASKSCEDF